MARVTGAAVLADYAPGKVENSFYKEEETVSVTRKLYRTDLWGEQVIYYTESDLNSMQIKNTLLG